VIKIFHILYIIIVLTYLLAAQSPVPPIAKVEKIADGFQFVEGPVWMTGVGLLFSDIPANKIYRWTPDSGVAVFHEPSGNSNGLALDNNGKLLMAQHGNRRLARLEDTGKETVLASHYDGKKLNSPNDIAVKSDGAIFFTDPPYGISSNQEELGYYGIYRSSPTGNLQLLDKTLNRPNGIVFSPDETRLYVGDSEGRTIYVWDVLNDSLIANKQKFAYMDADGYTDGMKVDPAGNLYATGPFGVWVYADDGTVLDTILVPGQTSNCNWGHADGKTLYITSGDAVYRINLGITSIKSQREGNSSLPQTLELYANYPNPFNSSTLIPFHIPTDGMVNMAVFDVKGELISTLINEHMERGNHQIHWDARNMSSGTYLIKLYATGDTDLKKCVLIR